MAVRTDAVLAAALTLGLAAELAAGDPEGTGTLAGDPVAVAPLGLVMIGALLWRRDRPLLVAVVVNVANALLAIATDAALSSIALWIAWLCAMYMLSVRTDARAFGVGVAVTAASFGVVGLAAPEVQAGLALWVAATLAAMWVLRRVVRSRDERASELTERAALLAHERDLRAREAVVEERERIARELHDIVAHEVSMIVVQAGTERRVLGAENGSTHETLGAIEHGGRRALGEMRRLLGLRLAPSDGVPLAPSPSLTDIDELVSRVRNAGLQVELDVSGVAEPLPPGLDVSAYRIVQEALTNTLKHADARHVTVSVRYAPERVEVEVRDDGGGAAVNGSASANGGGHGLIGMRERVALYGGRLDAGPCPDGGFRVHAELPRTR